MDLEHVPWDALHPQTARALRALAVAAPTAILFGDIVVQHWFAGRFGPDFEAHEARVRVPDGTDIAMVGDVIRGLYPMRWQISAASPQAALTIDEVVLGLVDARPAFHGSADGLADLRSGVLRPRPGTAEPEADVAFAGGSRVIRHCLRRV